MSQAVFQRSNSELSNDEKTFLVTTVLEEIAIGKTAKVALENVADIIDKPVNKCINVWNYMVKSIKDEFEEAKAKGKIAKTKLIESNDEIPVLSHSIWTEEEDEAIYQLAKNSSRKNHLPQGAWIKLAKKMGRTIFACQARWGIIKSNYQNQNHPALEEESTEIIQSTKSTPPTSIMSKKISELVKHFESIEFSFTTLENQIKELEEEKRQDKRTINQLNKDLADSKSSADQTLSMQNTVLQEQLDIANRNYNLLEKEFKTTKEDLNLLGKALELGRKISAQQEVETNSTPKQFIKDKEGNIAPLKN